MAQTNFTPILTYKSDTATSVPSAGNLTNSANGAELAVNTADKRLFTKDSGGNVVEVGTNPSSMTLPNGSANGVLYLNGSKVLTSGSALVFDGTQLGIGISPSYPLHVAKTSGYVAAFRGTTAANSGILVGNTAGDTAIQTLSTGDSFIFSDTGKYLAFGQNGGTEGMRLTSTGLGIGTSSPAQKLEVNGSILAGNYYGPQTAFNFGTPDFSASIVGYGTTGVGLGTSALSFRTAGTERMFLNSSGNLGLGVTPSAYQSGWRGIQILGTGANIKTNGSITIDIASNTTGDFKYAETNLASTYRQTVGQHQWYTAGSGTAGNPISFTQAMTLDASGNLGIGTTSPGCRIDVVSPNNTSLNPTIRVNSNNVAVNSALAYDGLVGSGEFELRTSSASALKFGTNATERARIDSSGNLLVGTTSTLGGAKQTIYSSNLSLYTGISLQNGTAYPSGAGAYISFYNSAGSVAGYINQTGTTTVAYTTSSDYRLKENITPMTGALAKVAQLKPVTYKWKSDGLDSEGFIAHELAEVCPQAVVGEKDAVDADGNPKYQGIDTSFLVATLTAALQELNAKFDAYVATHP